MKIDVVIIATRRVALLERTLESFSKHVFRNFDINKTVVNIDPIWGDAQDHALVKEFLTENFSNLEFIEPKNPNFCKAVKSAWLQTRSDFVFHLEEDWIALQDVLPEQVEGLITNDVKQLSFMNTNKNWNGKLHYHYKRYRPWYLPFKVEDRRKPHFSTSPGVWNGDFLRECAIFLDEQYDPEKQFYSGVNLDLESFVKNKKCRFLIGASEPNLIEDIGREWQSQNKVVKTVVNGQSYWS